MFNKPIRVKSQSQLKSSEKKKLISEITENFSYLSAADISRIFPPKAEICVAKAVCSKGEYIFIYMVQKEPLFFKLDKSNELLPTVYFLWMFPNSLKVFTTLPNVVERLRQGADLMLPGIIVEGDVTIHSYGKFDKGKLVAINTSDNMCPFAVGRTAMSSMDMYMAARHGRGVTITHIYRDHLWEMGSKSPITVIDPGRDISMSESVLHKALEDMAVTADNEIDESTDMSIEGPEAMDELLYYCFLKALKTSLKKVELPFLTSNFYRLHMVPACPANQNLDVKKSSYKKLSKFLKSMSEKNLVTVKEFPKGVENITAINFVHEDLKSFEVLESDVSVPKETKEQTSNGFVPPVLEEVFQVSGTTLKFFKANRLSKGDVLTRAEVRNVITSYIDQKQLKRNDKVEVDPLLHEAAVNPKEGYKEFLRWDEIFSRFLGKMAPAVKITREGQLPIVKKGKLDPIEIAVAKRSGNKKVTLIYNAGCYGIDEQEFAHQVQVGVATSTSVGPAENKPQGTTQILIQGNQVLFVGKLLLETYKLPRKYIKGLELAPKRK